MMQVIISHAWSIAKVPAATIRPISALPRGLIGYQQAVHRSRTKLENRGCPLNPRTDRSVHDLAQFANRSGRLLLTGAGTCKTLWIPPQQSIPFRYEKRVDLALGSIVVNDAAGGGMGCLMLDRGSGNEETEETGDDSGTDKKEDQQKEEEEEEQRRSRNRGTSSCSAVLQSREVTRSRRRRRLAKF